MTAARRWYPGDISDPFWEAGEPSARWLGLGAFLAGAVTVAGVMWRAVWRA